MEKTNRPTVRELLERIAENVDGIEPKDRLAEEKKARQYKALLLSGWKWGTKSL